MDLSFHLASNYHPPIPQIPGKVCQELRYPPEAARTRSCSGNQHTAPRTNLAFLEVLSINALCSWQNFSKQAKTTTPRTKAVPLKIRMNRPLKYRESFFETLHEKEAANDSDMDPAVSSFSLCQQTGQRGPASASLRLIALDHELLLRRPYQELADF